ncbi:GlxA family transcriptional regulator [Streptomyces avidinii]|uniref:GlxA family transcriptional regulator n=1 Tax=Streptomyces avidinii TaxID=1895 RepID=UPI00379BA7DE
MKIAVLALDGVFDSGLAAILDVLQAANALRGDVENPPQPWDVRTVGVRRRIRTGQGHHVDTESIASGQAVDLLVLPALSERTPNALLELVASPLHRPARRLITEAREQGTPLASSCTGTFLLAESGVLNGLRATTSWWLSPVFRQSYPAVTLDETRLVTTSDGITTAGAAFSHLDLALALVRMRSPVLADLVRRFMVMDDRESQAAYAIPSALAQCDPLVSAFETWVRAHLGQPLSVSEAARDLGVSERTLQRTMAQTLGCTPVHFIQDLRIERATYLLRTTRLPLSEIASRVGYESSGALRSLLRRRGTSSRDQRP